MTYKEGLIRLYEDQVSKEHETTFMKLVLNEAIRKLKETDLEPKRIERWVVKLEKTWRNP
jgi:hypothetical protein